MNEEILNVISSFAAKEIALTTTPTEIDKINKYWNRYFNKLNKYINVPDNMKEAAWQDFEDMLAENKEQADE